MGLTAYAYYVCLSKMADPPSSSPPLSPSGKRWSRHEIPLSRREGEEVLARRLRRAPPRKPAPLPRHSFGVKRYSCVYNYTGVSFVGRAFKIRREVLEEFF